MSGTVPAGGVTITESDRRAVAECLAGGWLTMGPRTQRFEAALGEWTGAPHAVACGEGLRARQRLGRHDREVMTCLAHGTRHGVGSGARAKDAPPEHDRCRAT